VNTLLRIADKVPAVIARRPAAPSPCVVTDESFSVIPKRDQKVLAATAPCGRARMFRLVFRRP